MKNKQWREATHMEAYSPLHCGICYPLGNAKT